MWTWEVPLAYVGPCLAMLPRLEAEESLSLMQVVGAGTGSLHKHTLRRVVGALQRTAAGGRGRSAAQAPTAADLLSMGITPVTVPKGRADG